MRPAFSGSVLLALGAVLMLAACATGAPGRSSGSPTVRCMDEPGRGQSPGTSVASGPATTRPLFFLFCAQSP